MNNPAASRRRGIVLLLVLCILGVLSVLAMAFVQVTRLESRISRNYVDRTQALLAAESGIEFAASRLLEFRGGVMRLDEQAQLTYSDDLKTASFQLPGYDDLAISGFVSSDGSSDGNYFALQVDDESAKLNLNDSNGKWNLDDDPFYDDPVSDPDFLDAPGRLRMTVEALGEVLFGSSVIGSNIANALFDEDPMFTRSRPNQPGDKFSNMQQVKDALTVGYPEAGMPAALSEDQWPLFERNVTLYSWQDPHVLRPTYSVSIASQYSIGQPADMFNIYLYSDMQTRRFEKEPRSPVNINLASLELIEALIEPVRGWYLYEGQPCSLADDTLGPWMKAFRSSSYTWIDTMRSNGFTNNLAWNWPLYSPTGPSWTLGNATRYGEARQTLPLNTRNTGIVNKIATRMYERIHGTDIDGDSFPDISEGPRPFLTWDEFHRFVYEMVDVTAQIVYDVSGSPDTHYQSELTGEDEAERMPYFLTRDCDYALTNAVVPGFDRYQADALIANFNPNARLNDHNPDMHIFQHVDKTQLTQYTTEASLQPTGVFGIKSTGAVRDPDGKVNTQTTIKTVMRLFHLLRITTQDQFMGDPNDGGYNPDKPDSLYDLMAESFGFFSTSGCDMSHGAGTGGSLSGGFGASAPRLGPSVCSYPDPVRQYDSISISNHPDTPGLFSASDGYLMLSTWSPARDRYPTDNTGAAPIFMAPMANRKLTTAQAANWGKTSLAFGNMMPALWGLGNSSSVNPDPGTTNIGGGRGTLVAWQTDYSAPMPTGAGIAPTYYKMVHNPFTHMTSWINDAPWNHTPAWHTEWHINYDHSLFAMMLNWGTVGPQIESFLSPGMSASDLGMTEEEFQAFLLTLGPAALPPSMVDWNIPWDGPVTPEGPEDRMQGNLYPDGAFSESGRAIGYMTCNIGSNYAREGGVCFWVKPNWDAGYSNRIREFFSLGHTGSANTNALDLIYFPASKRMGVGPDEHTTGSFNVFTESSFTDWPVPTHGFVGGWISNTFVRWHPTISQPRNLAQDTNFVVISPTATDFFPYRNVSEQAARCSLITNPNPVSLGFYGHQWNLMAMSYKNTQKNGDLTNKVVSYSINGLQIEGDLSEGVVYSVSQPNSDTDAVGNLTAPVWDCYLEDNPHHHEVWYNQDSLKPEPKYNHIGEGYMRFGWSDEYSGPTGDSTYDEIVTWAHPVDMGSFELGLWSAGRYHSDLLPEAPDATMTNDSVIGLYTSPPIDVMAALRHELSRQSLHYLRPVAVNWTLYWPRYNWRPEHSDSSNPETWGKRFDGIQGVDLQEDLAFSPEPDPVTGKWDPISVDVYSESLGHWAATGAQSLDHDDKDLYRYMENMPAFAGGSSLRDYNMFCKTDNDDFRYRIYFHARDGQTLLESPVLDDITFTFATNRPVMLSWEIILE